MAAMALLLIAGGVAAYVCHIVPWPWIAGFCGAMLMLLLLLRRAVIRPLDMVETGYDMLNSQDFNSRIRTVGEYHADKVANLFNRMSGELKNERLRLAEQESFLKQLVEVSPMGIAVLDFDYNVTMLNRAFMEMADLRGDGRDLEGRPLKSIRSELVEAIAAVDSGKSATVRLSDTKIYRVSNLWFMDSGFRRPFVIVESLTKEIMKAERVAYGKVIRVISHEVNNTMGGVASLLEIIADSTDDPEMRAAIESGEERCRSLSDFIRNYTDVVKLADPVIVEWDMNTRIRRLAPFLKTFTGCGIELGFSLADEPLTVKADPIMWEQVLINLVKNSSESIAARMQSQPGVEGRITLTAFRDDSGAVTVEVTDNGSGIDAETSRKLFTPFFSTKSNGRGIGLTLVNEILQMHNCRYRLRTDADGLTRFSIRFTRPHPA